MQGDPSHLSITHQPIRAEGWQPSGNTGEPGVMTRTFPTRSCFVKCWKGKFTKVKEGLGELTLYLQVNGSDWADKSYVHTCKQRRAQSRPSPEELCDGCVSVHPLFSLCIVGTQWTGGGSGGAEARPCWAPVSGAPRVAVGVRRGRRGRGRRMIVLWEVSCR